MNLNNQPIKPAFDPKQGYLRAESFKNFFKEKSSLVMEKNYSYNIPKDKELLMYDFYMMVHWLDTLNYEPGQQYDQYGNMVGSDTMRMGLRESTKYSFDEIKAQIIAHLEKELLETSLFAAACELRHWTDIQDNRHAITKEDKWSKPEMLFLNAFKYNFDKKSILYASSLKTPEIAKDKKRMNLMFGDENHANQYIGAYAAARATMKKFNMEDWQFMALCKKAYEKLKWGSSYGGPAWAGICDAYLKLWQAKSQLQKIIYIDNIYHMQHNTDTMFNKVQDFYKAGPGYAWILNALNFKCDNKEPWELIRKIKNLCGDRLRSVDRMYIEMLKAAGKQTYRAYFQLEEPEEEKKEEKKELKEVKKDKAEAKKEVDKQTSLGTVGNPNKDYFVKLANTSDTKTDKAGNIYISIGPAQNGVALTSLLNVTDSDLAQYEGTDGAGHGVFTHDYAGSSSYTNYYIKKSLWETIFGGHQEGKKTDASKKAAFEGKYNEEYFREKAKEKIVMPDFQLVYIGKGSNPKNNEKSLQEILKVYSDYLYIRKSNNKWDSGYNGNDPKKDYYLRLGSWQNIFGSFNYTEHLPKDVKSPTGHKVNFTHTYDLAYFMKQSTSAYDKDGKFVRVGPGISTTPLSELLNILPLFYVKINGAGYTEVDTKGVEDYRDYWIPRTQWESIFGPFDDTIISKSKGDFVAAHKGYDVNYFIKMAEMGKEGKEDLSPENFKKGFIYVGRGDDETNLKYILNLTTDKIYSTTSPEGEIGNEKEGNNSGSDPSFYYYIKKDEWIKLFGDQAVISGFETNSDHEFKFNEYYTPAYFKLKAAQTKTVFPNLAKNYVYIGTGNETYGPLREVLNLPDEIPIWYLEESDPMAMSKDKPDGKPEVGGNSNGLFIDTNYFLDKSEWEKLFSTSNMGDKEKDVTVVDIPVADMRDGITEIIRHIIGKGDFDAHSTKGDPIDLKLPFAEIYVKPGTQIDGWENPQTTKNFGDFYLYRFTNKSVSSFPKASVSAMVDVNRKVTFLGLYQKNTTMFLIENENGQKVGIVANTGESHYLKPFTRGDQINKYTKIKDSKFLDAIHEYTPSMSKMEVAVFLSHSLLQTFDTATLDGTDTETKLNDKVIYIVKSGSQDHVAMTNKFLLMAANSSYYWMLDLFNIESHYKKGYHKVDFTTGYKSNYVETEDEHYADKTLVRGFKQHLAYDNSKSILISDSDSVTSVSKMFSVKDEKNYYIIRFKKGDAPFIGVKTYNDEQFAKLINGKHVVSTSTGNNIQPFLAYNPGALAAYNSGIKKMNQMLKVGTVLRSQNESGEGYSKYYYRAKAKKDTDESQNDYKLFKVTPQKSWGKFTTDMETEYYNADDLLVVININRLTILPPTSNVAKKIQHYVETHDTMQDSFKDYIEKRQAKTKEKHQDDLQAVQKKITKYFTHKYEKTIDNNQAVDQALVDAQKLFPNQMTYEVIHHLRSLMSAWIKINKAAKADAKAAATADTKLDTLLSPAKNPVKKKSILNYEHASVKLFEQAKSTIKLKLEKIHDYPELEKQAKLYVDKITDHYSDIYPSIFKEPPLSKHFQSEMFQYLVNDTLPKYVYSSKFWDQGII